MNILGTDGFSSACIICDGKLVAFAEKDRFTRVKGSNKLLPVKAIAYCLSYAKLGLDSVDKIAFAWDATKYPWVMMCSLGVQYLKHKGREKSSSSKERGFSLFSNVAENLIEYTPAKIYSNLFDAPRSAGLKGKIPQV